MKHYRGSCLCGGVQFSVTSFDTHVAHCHCSLCRKFHGAAFATIAAVSGLKWHSGRELLSHFKATNGSIRTFCSVCGSSVGFRASGQPESATEIALSLFDDDIPVRPDTHIYTASAARWYDPDDRLPACPEGRPSTL